MPTTGQFPPGDNPVGGVGNKISVTWRWVSPMDYVEENGPDGTVIRAKIQTDWTDAIIAGFPTTMLGSHRTAAAKIRRVTPEPHPKKSWLYCTRCDLIGGIGYVDEESSGGAIKAASQGSQTPQALWQAEWGYLGYKVKTDQDIDNPNGGLTELNRYVSRRSQFVTEALPIQGTTWKYSSDNAKIPEPTTIPMNILQLEYTWHWVPEPLNETVWRGLVNNVNQATFDTYYSPGTVLFAQYEKGDLKPDPSGALCRDVTFFFQVRETLWNNFWRPSTNTYEAVVAAADGTTRPFTVSSFTPIFTGPT